ncbi:TldD/PmbA family protein [Streptomyces morookaense]|uniref:TldD/PmbA family protein n=1 Tax=Streptomyces morookaense TaxID=1970 RepID=UPI0033D68274
MTAAHGDGRTDETAHRTVTVTADSVTERTAGRHDDVPLLTTARLNELARELREDIERLTGRADVPNASDVSVTVRMTSRWECRRPPGSDPVQRTRLEAVTEIRVPRDGRTAPVVWQWAGPDPLAALRSATAQLTGEIRAAATALPLSGTFTGDIVLAPETAVHFAHETLGHSLEADNYHDYAARSGLRLGLRIATEALTVTDGPRPGEPEQLESTYRIDDEGHPATLTRLVTDGVVTGVMTDAAHATLQQLPRTGNGRRSLGTGPAQPRMSALSVAAGSTPAADMIRSVRRGLYCRGAWGGGSVEDLFVIRPGYAEWIEDGALTGVLVRRLDIKGNKTAALRALRQVGDDVACFNPVTGCGKNGQELPVGVAAPSLACEDLTAVPVPGPRPRRDDPAPGRPL